MCKYEEVCIDGQGSPIMHEFAYLLSLATLPKVMASSALEMAQFLPQCHVSHLCLRNCNEPPRDAVVDESL